MSVVALSSTVFSAASGDTYVSSAQTYPTRVFLASSFSQNDKVRFESTAGGTIEVLTSAGRRVGIVPGYGYAVAVQKGDNDTDGWVLQHLPVNGAAFNAACPAGGTGAAAGGFDTAPNRDAMITLVNAMRTALINAGIMKAE